jgi:hypothetical protein
VHSTARVKYLGEIADANDKEGDTERRQGELK